VTAHYVTAHDVASCGSTPQPSRCDFGAMQKPALRAGCFFTGETRPRRQYGNEACPRCPPDTTDMGGTKAEPCMVTVCYPNHVDGARTPGPLTPGPQTPGPQTPGPKTPGPQTPVPGTGEERLACSARGGTLRWSKFQGREVLACALPGGGEVCRKWPL